MVETQTNHSGIAVLLSVTTITQVHTVYISYVAWRATDLKIITGRYAASIENKVEISHIPESNVGRNYARIYGITGFIVNRQNAEFIFNAQWTGAKFVFDFEANIPLTKYISF